jgi:hypothetical protein
MSRDLSGEEPMKRTPAAALAALLLHVVLNAQSPPDFSGTWTLDPTRSQSAQQGEPFKSVTFVITQSIGQVRIEATRGDEKESVLYPLTKSRASVGASGQSEAYWDGEQLVTVTQRTVSGQSVTVKEVRTLGPGGTDMTVETTVIVQHGYSMPGAKNYGNSKDVFTRSKP